MGGSSVWSPNVGSGAGSILLIVSNSVSDVLVEVSSGVPSWPLGLYASDFLDGYLEVGCLGVLIGVSLFSAMGFRLSVWRVESSGYLGRRFARGS